MVYALFNKHDEAVVAVVSRKDVADRWYLQSPEFHKVMPMTHKASVITIKGKKRTVDDLMDVVDAFLRDVVAGGGD